MNNIKLSWPGHRTIKTAISVAICTIIYTAISRDSIMMAVTAAIICLQDSVEKSIALGKCRVVGTLAGGILGALCLFSELPELGHLGLILCSFFGVIILIHFFHTIKMPQGSVISAIVFMIILSSVLVPEEENIPPIIYSVNRVIDTLIGIVVSVVINTTLFRPTQAAASVAVGADNPAGSSAQSVISVTPQGAMNYELVLNENTNQSKWSGGTSREIYIYPPHASYDKRNFDFRISSASIEVENAEFTKLPGYKRYILPTEGNMSLTHENQYSVDLLPFEKDYFLGQWNTISQGLCRDFNLIISEDFSGNIDALRSGFQEKLTSKSFNGFYCLQDQVIINISSNGETISENLNKYDFIAFPQDAQGNISQYDISISGGHGGYIAIKASVY